MAAEAPREENIEPVDFGFHSSDRRMILEIITPDGQLHGEVASLSFFDPEGSKTVRKNHAPLISAVSKGEIKIRKNETELRAPNSASGVVSVSKNKIRMMLDHLSELKSLELHLGRHPQLLRAELSTELTALKKALQSEPRPKKQNELKFKIRECEKELEKLDKQK